MSVLCPLSNVESEFLAFAFFVRSRRYHQSRWYQHHSVPLCGCKIWLLYIKLILIKLAIEWRDSFFHVCSKSGTALHYVCSVTTASFAKWRSCCIGRAKNRHWPPLSFLWNETLLNSVWRELESKLRIFAQNSPRNLISRGVALAPGSVTGRRGSRAISSHNLLHAVSCKPLQSSS